MHLRKFFHFFHWRSIPTTLALQQLLLGVTVLPYIENGGNRRSEVRFSVATMEIVNGLDRKHSIAQVAGVREISNLKDPS